MGLIKKGDMKGLQFLNYSISYVWIVIVASVLVFSFYVWFSAPCVKSTQGFSGSGVEIVDFGVSNDTYLQIAVRNDHHEPLEIGEVSFDNELEKEVDYDFNPGEQKVIELEGFSNADECQQVRTRFKINRGSLTESTISGTLTDSFEYN